MMTRRSEARLVLDTVDAQVEACGLRHYEADQRLHKLIGDGAPEDEIKLAVRDVTWAKWDWDHAVERAEAAYRVYDF